VRWLGVALIIIVTFWAGTAGAQSADSTSRGRFSAADLHRPLPTPLPTPHQFTGDGGLSVPVRSAGSGRRDSLKAGESEEGRAASWELRLDGRPADWPGASAPSARIGEVESVAEALLSTLRERGYYYARIDSAVVRRSSQPARVRLHATRGPQVVVGQIDLEGNETVSEDELRRAMNLESDTPLRPGDLHDALAAMRTMYRDAGYPMAEVQVAGMRLRQTAPAKLSLTLRIDEGPPLWLRDITLPDGSRTSSSLVAHLAELQLGKPLVGYDPSAVRSRLRSADFFASVGQPELRVDSTGGALLHVPVEEREPGSFDLALGYLPPSGDDGGGQIVGSGHLSLRNLFGGGRTADLELDRRPGQASLFDVRATDPYLLGRPLQMEGRFRGEQRDSTFSERMYRFGLGYRFDGGLTVTGTLTREVTRPGQAGAQIRDDRQRIPRSEALFYGVRLQVHRVDDRRNPRRGGSLSIDVERGAKDRRFFERTAEADTIRQRESVRQERVEGRARLYVPLLSRQVLAAGVDASVLLSPSYDRSDLFRLGGARSLRGYDEDRFLGSSVGRLLLEYRLQIDRVSYAYAFADLGYVERPSTESGEASSDVHPGYGIGIQFGTAIGLVNTSYALQPGDTSPAGGRVHLRLSFDL